MLVYNCYVDDGQGDRVSCSACVEIALRMLLDFSSARARALDETCFPFDSYNWSVAQPLQVILLNEDGCALDPHLLQSLEYSSDLVAGQSAHVFKYADRTNLYFNCQIRIDVKEPNKECQVR